MPAGTPVRDVAAAISPRLAQGGARRRSSTAGWSISSFPLDDDAARAASSPTESPEALPLYRHSTAHLLAAAVTNLFPGAQCGIGPATDEGLLLRLRRRPRPFVPEDLEAIEQKMQELAGAGSASTSARCGRARKRRRSSPKRGEPLKVQLIDEKTAGPDRSLLLHDQGQGDVRRLLRRPARAVDRQAEGVQAAEHVERLLEGRRAQPADAAHLRHRVLLATRT